MNRYLIAFAAVAAIAGPALAAPSSAGAGNSADTKRLPQPAPKPCIGCGWGPPVTNGPALTGVRSTAGNSVAGIALVPKAPPTPCLGCQWGPPLTNGPALTGVSATLLPTPARPNAQLGSGGFLNNTPRLNTGVERAPGGSAGALPTADVTLDPIAAPTVSGRPAGDPTALNAVETIVLDGIRQSGRR